MALGRWVEERQQEMWIASAVLPKSQGHVFYRKLNQLLAEAGFDRFVEELCQTYYFGRWASPAKPY